MPDRATTAPSAAYHTGLARGELRFQRCADCAQAVFPPRVLCPHCGSEALASRASLGLGTVYDSNIGGSSFVSHLLHAAAAIEAGLCGHGAHRLRLHAAQ